MPICDLRARVIELDPIYCDRILARWEAFAKDEAEWLDDKSGDNEAKNVKIPVSQAWSKAYGARVLVDRNKVEASIKATNSGANALRSMLGLPLRAGTIKGVGGDVWLHQMSVDDALGAGTKGYAGRGAKKP